MTAQSIPVSQLINVIPQVLGPGGTPLSMNAVIVTEDPSIPIGAVMGFANLAAVAAWFGANSNQAALAAVYFGITNKTTQAPNVLYFAQYNLNAVGAYLRSGSVAAITLAQLQAFSGDIIIAIDGRTVTSAAINLAGATSFSNAAALMQTGLQTTGGIFSGTGTVTNASATLTINSTVSGQLHVGDVVVGTDIPAATTILSFGTYTTLAGTGTVTMSANATGAAGPEAVTVSSIATVTYDSLRAAFVIATAHTGTTETIAYPTDTSLSPLINLTQATGAVLSQGAAATTPAVTMNAVTAATQNWATFMTDWLPTQSIMLGFAVWVNGQDDQYLYVAYDNNAAAEAPAATTSFGYLVGTNGSNYSGVCAIWDPSGLIAALVCGATAGINFNEEDARISYAYLNQPGLPLEVTSATVALNLIANGYSFYGAYASRGQNYQWFQNGQLAGGWGFLDPYIDQVYWNAALQQQLANLLSNVKSIPYNLSGYNLIRTTLQSTIQAMISFGAIVPGVTLSGSQIAALTAAVGKDISQALFTYGYYLQVADPGPTVRGVRGSPICNLYFTDGGSIQTITLGSVDVE